MAFVKITKDAGPYKAGIVHEVNENRKARLIASKCAESHNGPATPPPAPPKPVVEEKPVVKSAATAAKASPPGRKVKK